MTTSCALAFGGNFAGSEDYFQQAITELARAETACQSFANVIRSAPMGASAGSEFVNSAGVFETKLAPKQLLETIHKIETELGRQRSLHWGPRPIDIDVLFYNQLVIDTAEVVIPHPCLWYRSFVLKPLQEICPDWIHPIFGEDVRMLADRISEQPLQIKIQNRRTALSAQQIAEEAWSSRIRPLKSELSDTQAIDSTDVFAEIVIELPQQTSPIQKPRTQPHQESGRVIRCPLKHVADEQGYRQFLTDLEAAIVG